MIRLALRVRREQAELVLAELLSLAPGGVEEVERSDHVEYAVYGAPGELPSLPELKAAAGAALVDVSTSELPDDWNERWKSFHRPVLVRAPAPPARDLAAGKRRRVSALRVRPPWEPSACGDEQYAEPDGQAVEEIVIDPGQAFGTGAHASTRLCLALLLALSLEQSANGPLVDVGCGSGVLAIAASKLDFAPVLALDNDPLSVTAARENAARNDAGIDVRRLDLREQLPAPGDGQGTWQDCVVLANLLRPLLLELAARLPAAPRHLIAAGLLPAQVDEVAGAFAARLGLRERERRDSCGWAALWLARQ